MRRWASMHDVPIGDRRNLVLEVRGFGKGPALAYWTGDFWAKAPVRPNPRALGWKPEWQRRTLTVAEWVAKLTRSQRVLMRSLRDGGFGGFEWVGAPEWSLESGVALWRRGFIASDVHGQPDSLISGGRLVVRLTDDGRELMRLVQEPTA